MKEYLEIFVDSEYPKFIDKYLTTATMERIKKVTQFCGCDYTNIYSPLFLYTRFDHSLVVAHMTWHFTHDKKETIKALLHDADTPCFAHCIDYVFGDYVNQETSERSLSEMVKRDREMIAYLEEDGISLDELDDFSNCPVLENKSPQLCTDRLDGILHTCYIWLHTHSLMQIKEVYDDMTVLQNEDGTKEIGFKSLDVAERFVKMVEVYAKELQGNKDKYVMKYISEMIKLAVQAKLISLEDLYSKSEEEICEILRSNFASWSEFNRADTLIKTDEEPKDTFYISFATKKRNAIPLVRTPNGSARIKDVSSLARKVYDDIDSYKDSKYAYLEEIKDLYGGKNDEKRFILDTHSDHSDRAHDRRNI